VDSQWVKRKGISQLDTISEDRALPALGFEQPPQRTVKAVTRLRDTGEHLLLKRSPDRCKCPGLWESPGGLIEEGEEPREAALRELREETGLMGDIEDSHQPARTTSIHGQFKVYPFLVGVDNRSVKLSSEHTDYSWVEDGDSDDRSTVSGYEREVGAFR
jgi:8-oxo-dGTP pyrophosphatase MutT (NUDIX family)